jgi:uncharacterized membrane protein YqjE
MILQALTRLGQASVEIVRTRLAIISLDVKEAWIRYIAILMLGAITILLLSLGLILGMFSLILTFWPTEPILVVGIISVSLLISGLVILIFLILRLKKVPGVFDGVINELGKDVEALGFRDRSEL